MHLRLEKRLHGNQNDVQARIEHFAGCLHVEHDHVKPLEIREMSLIQRAVLVDHDRVDAVQVCRINGVPVIIAADIYLIILHSTIGGVIFWSPRDWRVERDAGDPPCGLDRCFILIIGNVKVIIVIESATAIRRKVIDGDHPGQNVVPKRAYLVIGIAQPMRCRILICSNLDSDCHLMRPIRRNNVVMVVNLRDRYNESSEIK